MKAITIRSELDAKCTIDTTACTEREHMSTIDGVIRLKHVIESDFEGIHQQLWNASLLLADFILDIKPQLNGAVILEIAAGTGFLSVLLARNEYQILPKHIFCTDLPGTLALIQENVDLNKVQDQVSVRVLDFCDNSPLSVKEGAIIPSRFCWNAQDLDLLQECSLIFAADVLYEDSITFSFVKCLPKLLYPNRSLYLALERRLQFTFDARVTAPAVDYFFDTLNAFNEQYEYEGRPTVEYEKVDLRIGSLHFLQELDTERMEIWLLKLS